jgi:hypothetical protein
MVRPLALFPLLSMAWMVVSGCSQQSPGPEIPQERAMQSSLQQAAPPGMSEEMLKMYRGEKVDPAKLSQQMFPQQYPGMERRPRQGR